jgi:hypothetical protein
MPFKTIMQIIDDFIIKFCGEEMAKMAGITLIIETLVNV